uniref:ELKS/RAB6-interacting/CAST family member 2 n=1 Tax=Fundulus heteroclitus TaxID=8078 RepID=A0A3Q2UNB8_FUNHE
MPLNIRPGSRTKVSTSTGNKGSARGSATAPGGKTLSMENIQSISAAYATSGTMYPSERESLEPSGGYPKGTMTLGRSTRRSSYGNRTTAIGSTPNITQTASSMHHISDSCGDQTVLSTGTSSLRRQSGRFTQTLDSADRGEVSTYDLQAQLRDLQRENENLRRELDGGRDGKTSYGMSSVNFWSPDVKRDKGSRREEGVRTPALKEQCRLNQDDLQQLPLTVQELQEELRAHRETNSRLRQQREQGSSYREHQHERQANELSLLRKTMEEMEMRIDSQKQTLGVRDESIQRLLEMLQGQGHWERGQQTGIVTMAAKEADAHLENMHLREVRQAYFYRVPPPELHRRNQLQADPAKTRTLQTVIDMKDTKISSLERNIRDLEDEVQMLKTTGLLHPDDRQDELKQVDVYKSHTKFMKTKVDQMKQDLNRKDSEMQALQTKLETLTNQNSDYKQHIEVLKESLSAKEQRANTLQTEVRVLRGFFTHSSKQNIIYALTLYRCFDRDSLIENLRDQKEREDRVRLEEMQLMRKGNQELKDKLAAQQSQKLSHSQVTNSSLIPNQRPDGEVSTQKPEETVRTCPDIADRLRLLEQEVARYREESGKSQAEVERLKGALKDAEVDKSWSKGQWHSCPPHKDGPQDAMRETAERIMELEKALRETMNTSAHREALWAQEEAARVQAQRQLEELMGALEKTRQELDATKVRLSSTQKCLHERDGHLNQLRQERRKQLEEILEMKQQALLAAISEKDANIALLELSSSKRKKAQEEVMALKREKDRLMHQLKQQVHPPDIANDSMWIIKVWSDRISD